MLINFSMCLIFMVVGTHGKFLTVKFPVILYLLLFKKTIVNLHVFSVLK